MLKPTESSFQEKNQLRGFVFYFKEALTQNFIAKIAYGIDFREHVYLIYQISTACIVWRVTYMNIEVYVRNRAICTAPRNIALRDLKGTTNFCNVTTAAEPAGAASNEDIIVIALFLHLRQQTTI